MPEVIKGPERLLNLTLALLHTRNGLTKQEILSGVQGYREDFKPFGDNSSLERKFERDKESLRETGIPWEVFTLEIDDANNQESRYRISRERFEWPKEVTKLTSHQITLLNLAGKAWNQNSMSSEAARGLYKLKALAESVESSELIGLAPRIRTHHPTFASISLAISESKVIEFSYRKPNSTDAEPRRMQPWVLKNFDGQWVVTGWDEKRNEIRNFLLQRIVPARIQITADSFPKPKEAELAKAEALLQQHRESQVAVLQVTPGTRAWMHFGMDLESTTGSTEKSITYMDLHLLAAELRHFSGELEVLEPEALRNEVRAGFEKVASIHHG